MLDEGLMSVSASREAGSSSNGSMSVTEAVWPGAGCVSVPEAQEYAAAIDGTDGESWHLPLPPLDANSLEPHSLGESPFDAWISLVVMVAACMHNKSPKSVRFV